MFSGITGILVIVGVVVAAVLLWVAGAYNGLVAMRNRFKGAFSQIDVQLKRRHDLIPNLIETAKGYLAPREGDARGRDSGQDRRHGRRAHRGGESRATPRPWPGWPPPRASSTACWAGSSPSPRPIPTSRPTRT